MKKIESKRYLKKHPSKPEPAPGPKQVHSKAFLKTKKTTKIAQRWSGVENEFSVEAGLEGNGLIDSNGQMFPAGILQATLHALRSNNIPSNRADYFEFIVEFESAGYSEAPSGLSGPLEDSHPGGFEDERNVTAVSIRLMQPEMTIPMPPSVNDWFGEQYSDKMSEVEIDTSPPEQEYERDYDDMRI